MLAWANAHADPERCWRLPLPEEETEADDDHAAEAAHVQPRARPSALGLTPRRLAALAAALAGAMAVTAWGRAKGVRAASPLSPRWREGAVGLQEECTGVNEDCSATRCCADPALTCFEKDSTWAACIEGCEPGVHKDWDPPGHQTPWSCKPLSDLGTGAKKAAVEAEAEAPASCEDLLDDWQDAAGRSCQDYEQGRLCTASGDFGPGWNSSGGLPVFDVLGHGLSAAEACCACGGGSAHEGTWSLVHRDWRCIIADKQAEGASILADKQASDKLRLPDCQKFCISYRYVEFWTSQRAGACQCHSECSTDVHTNPGYSNLVYRWDVPV